MQNRSALALLTLLSLAPSCAPGHALPAGESASNRRSALDVARPETLGINIDPTNDHANPSADELAALGATRVRIELKVDYRGDLAPDDELAAAFARYDDALARVGAADVLFIVDYATLDQRRAGSPDSQGYRDVFSARAAATAAHFAPRVSRFEIWNEEDLCAGDYCPRVEPAPYAALLADAADAIHGANAEAHVALGGLGSGDWEAYLGEVRSALGYRWASVDAVGLHPYTHWPRATGRGPNELEYMLARASEIGAKPLWLTEWGDGGDARAMIESYFQLFSGGSSEPASVEEAYFFAWSDAQHEAPEAFGLFDRQGEKKSAEWAAFHDAASGASASP